jgi:chorismate-pyruvate lyase
MMNHQVRLLYPLDEFYSQAGLSLPSVRPVEGEDVPEPFQQLLVHENDMTPTLEAFHGGQLSVRVLMRRLEGDTYARHVLLTLNGSAKPVEFGAIVINLQHFPPAAREEILQERRPLGTILAKRHVEHTSRPLAFIRVTSDDRMKEALHLNGTPTLYGRRNVLRDANGNVLAEIVEILPPVKES